MSVNLPADVEAIVNSQIDVLRSSLQESVDQADRGELLDGDEAFDEILRELDAKGAVAQ